MRTVLDTFGSDAVLVDKLIGNSYQVVRYVATQIEYVKHVSAHMAEVYRVAQSIDDIEAVVESVAILEALHGDLAAILTVAEEVDNLSAVGANIATVLSVNVKLTEILAVYGKLTEIDAVADELAKISTVHTNLTAIVAVFGNLVEIEHVSENLDAILTSLDGAVSAIAAYAKTGTWLSPATGAVNETIDTVLRRSSVTPEMFGAVIGASQSVTQIACEKAAAHCRVSGSRLRLLGRVYSIGTAGSSPLNLDGVTVDPEPGAVIAGAYDIKSTTKFLRPMELRRAQDGFIFPPEITSTWGHSDISEKRMFLTEGDLLRGTSTALACPSIPHKKPNWSGGSDTWVAASPSEIDDLHVNYALTNDGYFQGELYAARGGDEIQCSWLSGNYTRAYAIVTTKRTILHYCMDEGSLTVASKRLGQVASAQSGISWAGAADHQSWYPSKSTWKGRLYSLQEYSLMLNGREIYGPSRMDYDEIILDHGFVMAASTSVTGGTKWWSLQRNNDTSGRGAISPLFLGDSTTAPTHGQWPEICVKALEGSFGYGVTYWENLAVDSTTALIMRDALFARGLNNISDVFLLLGTNDAQQGYDVAGITLNRIAEIIDYCAAANRRVHILNFPTFYTRSLTPLPHTGFETLNYEKTADYRAMIAWLAGNRGVNYADLNELLKSSLAYELPGGVYETSLSVALRDAIHDTETRYMLKGWAAARLIASQRSSKRRGLDEIPIPGSFYTIGDWVPGTSPPPKISISDDGLLKLSGTIDAGTVVSGASVLVFPKSLLPTADRHFLTYSSQGTMLRAILGGDGVLRIYNLVSGDTTIFLDMLSWHLP